MMDVKLMQPQADFIMDTTTRFIGLLGSYRAGKTFCLCLKAIQLACLNPGFNGLMLEPTYGMIEGVLIPCMEDVLQRMGYKEGTDYNIWTSSNNPRIELYLPNAPKGFNGKPRTTTIFLRASENYERIRGFSIAWFCADEFDTSGFEICQAAWQKIVSRLTHGNVMQGCVATTKEGYQWAYEFFVVKAGPDRRMVDIFVRDNPFITDEYVELMRQQLSPKQFDAYINNIFTNFQTGNVYYCFDREKNRSTETIEKHPNAPLLFGIDFNVGKMATTVGILIGHEGREQRLHIVDELWGCQNTDELIREIKRKYPNRRCRFFPDASGTAQKTNATYSDIELLRMAFGPENILNHKKNMLVVDRIGSVNAKLCAADGTRTVLVNDSTCPKTVKCLESQGYDKEGRPDKANDIDHYPDALGYKVSYLWPLRKNTGVGYVSG